MDQLEKNGKKYTFVLAALLLFTLSCTFVPIAQFTVTPSPSLATRTSSPAPTVLVPTGGATLRTDTPSPAPAGFEWADLPDLKYAILVPDGWFVKRVFQGDTEAIFVTEEDIEVSGRYSTGMGINIIQNVNNVDGAAQSFIQNIASLETTTKILDSIQMSSETNVVRMYAIVIEAELPINPNDPVPTPFKTLTYHAFADTETNTLITMIFESPSDQWESEWNERGVTISLAFIDSVLGSK